MKRSLIGVACAIVCTTAAAQASGVTLYGVADANIEYTCNNLGTGPDGHSKVALNSAASPGSQ
ncbi:hypothetical protein [Cupriavidus neocaledonicus]|uniref:Porin n=1 Tax=Cupriavidus neocaledonicus TaxID=1040979 RepID=A0A375H759_9BURK|nr:hypothetical protein [Cupriavidus neocaledonicus]SPD46706.1 exported protein of unknown function [Cupriavidus neocaledonicus]